jgi:hypothetical protein
VSLEDWGMAFGILDLVILSALGFGTWDLPANAFCCGIATS